jgi:cytoskeletal protein CcmA (bactofilin family)
LADWPQDSPPIAALPDGVEAARTKDEPMLRAPESNANKYPATPTSYAPTKTVSVPTEQATIGRSLVIKGEVSGAESLYVDGRIEGTITLTEHRVTIGRNGNVAANIHAKEVVIMGKVTGNVECSDRVDIRSEGSLTGDVITHRISVEDGALLKGGVQVRAEEKKNDQKKEQAKVEAPKPVVAEQTKAAAAGNA